MIQEVIKETAEQPTAYDVNKVVKQLKERSKEFNSGLRLHGKPEDILTDEAVEIVKCRFESLPRKSEKDLISKEQLINKLNSTGTNITFDLPVEEILGENVDLDDFAALMQDAIQVYRKMVIDTIENMPDKLFSAVMTVHLDVENLYEVKDKVIEFGKELYNKGIDDFLNEMLSHSESARPVGWLGKQEIVTIPVAIEIAERLKIV